MRREKGKTQVGFKQDLNTQLEREKYRAQRYGVRSSLVVFDLSMVGRPERAATILFEGLSGRIREADMIGWVADRKIGVLLPATGFAGANKLVGDMVERMKWIVPVLYNVRTFPEVDSPSSPTFPGDSPRAVYADPSRLPSFTHATQPPERLDAREKEGA